jgi:miniconductance mechanosensitive channel
MTTANILFWLNNNLYLTIPILAILSYLLYRGTQFILARGIYFATIRSENIYDDLIVDRIQPFRVAWLLPLWIVYKYSTSLFGDNSSIQLLALLLIIWVLADFLIALLSGINDAYKHNPRYTGVSVSGFIGVAKVLIVVGAIIWSIILLFDVQPEELVAGIGAWLAVLLLIFRDTILSFIASVQISSQKLLKDGDMVDVPAYGASGFVSEMNLQTIKIANFDNTTSNIPTYKIVDVGFKNYRQMLETKARRMQRSISLDLFSIKFCDIELLEKLARYDMIRDYVNQNIQAIKEYELEKKAAFDFPLDGPQITNLQLYSHYAEAYLKNRKDIRLKGYIFMSRTLEPGPKGLPFEIYIFIKAASWPEFEAIQTEIMNHLIAALPYFELRPFQIMYDDL